MTYPNTQKFSEEQKGILSSDKLVNAKSKHIAKAAQACATTKALSKPTECSIGAFFAIAGMRVMGKGNSRIEQFFQQLDKPGFKGVYKFMQALWRVGFKFFGFPGTGQRSAFF